MNTRSVVVSTATSLMVLIAGCSSTSDGSGEQASADPTNPIGSTDGDDASPSTTKDSGSGGSASGHDAAVSDAGIGGQDTGAGALGAPQPPPGAVPCGSENFTTGQALAACNSTATAVPGPPGAPQYSAQCMSLTTSGGKIQAWCAGTTVYVYARFEDVELPAAATCADHSEARIELSTGINLAYFSTSSSGKTGSTMLALGGLLRPAPAQPVAISATFNVDPSFHGNASVQFGLVGNSTCGLPTSTPPFPVVLGAKTTSIMVP